METKPSLSMDVQHERVMSRRWLIGALGLGVVAAVIARIVYVAVDTDLQWVILAIAGLLVAMCIFVAAMLSIEMYRTRARPKQERGKTD